MIEVQSPSRAKAKQWLFRASLMAVDSRQKIVMCFVKTRSTVCSVLC